MSYDGWAPYVPVAERRAKALKQMEKMEKKGLKVQPVQLSGHKIADSFWGKGWCDHVESFGDFANRLPRGRTYVRSGSVCHLDVKPERLVGGFSLQVLQMYSQWENRGTETIKIQARTLSALRRAWEKRHLLS